MPLSTEQLAAATAALGVDPDLLALALRLVERAPDLPALDPSGRTTIFLDSKDWIGLSRARLGQPEGATYADLYAALKAGAADATILVPLSASVYTEILSNRNPRQRTDLLAVVAEISGFASLAGTAITVRHQVRTAMATRLGLPGPAPIAPFGFGMAYAFGDRRMLTLRHTDLRPLSADEAYLERVSRAMAEVKLFTEPDPVAEAELRTFGYQPEAVIAARRAQLAHEQELEQILAADASARTRLPAIVTARHLAWRLLDHVIAVAAEYGTDPREFLDHDKDWLTDFVADIPSAAVHVTLTEAKFRDTSRPLKLNDLGDADAVAVAVPYCTIVMCDAFTKRWIATSPAVRKLGTTVFSKPADLLARLP